jgi:hypothetical protein
MSGPYVLDTSALLAHCREEPGHDLVERLLEEHPDDLCVSSITGVEFHLEMGRNRIAKVSASGLELAHDARHRQGCLRGLGAPVMCPAQATGAGLVFIFQEQDFVDDRDQALELNPHQGLADGLADMGGVDSLAAQDDTEADDRRGG